MEEFASSFHSLSGTTMGEKRKNLFHLLNRTQQAGSTELDFSFLQPRTSHEEKFKVEALIYFRRIPDLVGVLKSENPMFIGRVLKVGAWFWEQAFQDVTAEQLVTQLFPYISFTAKVKVVNRLSLHLKDPQRADTFFEAIKAKYGLFLASKLLSACSIGLIMNCIKTNRYELMPRQLLLIIKGQPEVIEDVLEALTANNVKVEKVYKSVFKYLAKSNMPLLQKLYKQYGVSVRVGWRITDKFVQTNRQQVINSPDMYYKFLHNKQIAKSLQNDFKECYYNLFPSDSNKFYDSHRWLFSVMEKLPRRMKNVQLYMTGYQKAYGTPLWEDDYYITTELIEMLSPDEREKLPQLTGFAEDDWCCYWKIEKSIPYLKKKISQTSDIKARAELISLLVKTCAVNAHNAALVHVCKYVLTKHRNDSITVRLAFLKTLQSKFNVENLEEQHWTHIHDMFQIFALNNETYYDSNYTQGYIHYCFINDLPVKDSITEWIKSGCSRMNIMTKSPQYEKQCLLMCGEVIPQVCTGQKLVRANINFLYALLDWNERHREDEISLLSYPDAFESLKQNIAEERFFQCIKSLIKYYARLKNAAEEQGALLNLCLKHYKFVDERLMKCFMKFEPSLIIQNINVAIHRVMKMESTLFFWKYCENSLPFEIAQEIIKVILHDYRDNEDDAIAENAVVALAHLMPKKEFLTIILSYYPANVNRITNTNEYQKMYKLQRKVCVCLRTINPPSLALDNIMCFCIGNSFTLIQSSLYSLCGNINEDKLIPFIDTLAMRSALIRKHALHLTLGLLDKQHKKRILCRFMETEQKASFRKLLFKSVFNLFIKNPEDYLWELVKSNVSNVTLNDEKLLDMLIQVDKIPSQYTIRYVVFVWLIVNSLSTDETVDSKRATILNSLTFENVQLLPTDFCEAIIKDHLFKCDDTAGLHAAVQSFTSKYIIYCNAQSDQEERLKVMFEILKNYVTAKWSDSHVRLASHKCVSNFFRIFCNELLTDKCLDKASLAKFSNLWNNFLKPHEAFNEYLHLQFTLISIEKLSLADTARKFEQLCSYLTETYGPSLVNLFCDKLNYFMKYILKDLDGDLDENQYAFLENFVRPDSSVVCLLLVILLLNDNHPKTNKSKQKYNSIVETLTKSTEPIIVLYLDRHFRWY